MLSADTPLNSKFTFIPANSRNFNSFRYNIHFVRYIYFDFLYSCCYILKKGRGMPLFPPVIQEKHILPVEQKEQEGGGRGLGMQASLHARSTTNRMFC